jgi:hypothetical protein
MAVLRTTGGRAATALVLLVVMGSACITSVPPPPTVGYGAPYHGTGEGIYTKDSRTNWDITEGHHKISSEQALEATGDTEYETRRQIAKAHNVELNREGYAHKDRGNLMIRTGIVATVAGAVLSLLVAPRLQEEAITPATATMPETRTYTSGAATNLTANLGLLLFVGGLAGISYGYFGGKKAPPYYEWKTPTALDRPAYVRQQTEPYNEKIGAPSIPDEDGNEKPQLKRKLPPQKMPTMRGGR